MQAEAEAGHVSERDVQDNGSRSLQAQMHVCEKSARRANRFDLKCLRGKTREEKGWDDCTVIQVLVSRQPVCSGLVSLEGGKACTRAQ